MWVLFFFLVIVVVRYFNASRRTEADIDYTDLYGDGDGDPLLAGYTGVINLEGDTPDGLCSYYDTLTSVVPEPATLSLLLFAGLAALKRRR